MAAVTLSMAAGYVQYDHVGVHPTRAGSALGLLPLQFVFLRQPSGGLYQRFVFNTNFVRPWCGLSSTAPTAACGL
jgi:hypothetical protein